MYVKIDKDSLEKIAIKIQCQYYSVIFHKKVILFFKLLRIFFLFQLQYFLSVEQKVHENVIYYNFDDHTQGKFDVLTVSMNLHTLH